ncbi:hypothetical protein E2562_002505 [Oryza meyeriana var. granulata]|uniref:Hexosyltransferase n=1 Tax=Oryza meyeriana var. granulata TaxID=110450 RepID=A0A6G1F2L2_9ORYZ|nr:hypothetical protein E2562_002505 [Oryza meyeriana var. granulata]
MMLAMKRLSSSLFVLPFLLIAFIYSLFFPSDFSILPSLARCNNIPATTANTTEPAVDFRVLLGVVTRAELYERRALLRLAYSLQPAPARAVIDVRFFVCSLTTEEDAVLVSLEIIAHGDIVVLNCTENMDDGKTYSYFSAVPGLFADAPYDYVGKIDDDSYYRLAALADTLRDKPRRDMYYGLLAPCHADPKTQFMSGMGYIVSWDVAAWVAATEALSSDVKGPEDEVFGRWLRSGGKGTNRYGEEKRMYDYLDGGMREGVNCFRHALVADTVVVHKLKDRLKWARTLKFFNATQGLKPSKLYHALQPQPAPARAVIDVRFVVCNLTKEEDALVELEIIAHGDIIVLNCTENMDDGKVHTYFSTVPRLFADAPYDNDGKSERSKVAETV